jgi:hypothetical protein
VINILEISPQYVPIANECFTDLELEKYLPQFFENMDKDPAYLYHALITLMKCYLTLPKPITPKDQSIYAKFIRLITFFIRVGKSYEGYSFYDEVPQEFQNEIRNHMAQLL